MLALVGILHEASGNAEAWLRFLEALRAEISPDAATIFVAQPRGSRQGIVAGSGLGVHRVDLGDFNSPPPPQPHPGSPGVGVREVPAYSSRFRETTLFREVLGPAGILPAPGLFLEIERGERQTKSAALVLPRRAGWQPTPSDLALLQRLAPHIVLARRLQLRLVERGRDTAALCAAFDRLALGVIFLDERLRVSFANLSAAEIIGIQAGFTDPVELAGEEPDGRTRALQRLLQSERGGERNTMVCAHPEDGRPLQVLSTPFGWRNGQAIGGARYARALFIGDPKRRAGDPLGVLHELYGLTRGEARLTMLLLGGASIEEASQAAGIAVATARSVLKKVFGKTGTNRQAGLMRLMLTGFGQVRRDGASTERSG